MKKTVYVCDGCGKQFEKQPNGSNLWILNWGKKAQTLRLIIKTQLYDKGKGTTREEINADFCEDCLVDILKMAIRIKKPNIKENDNGTKTKESGTVAGRQSIGY